MSKLSHKEQMTASKTAINTLKCVVEKLEEIHTADKPISVVHASFEKDGKANCIINGSAAELIKLYAGLLHSAMSEMPHILALAMQLATSDECVIESTPYKG